MANEFNPFVGTTIPKEEAQQWIARYDKEQRVNPNDTRSVFFGTDKIQEILKTPDAAGISFMFAKKFDTELQRDVVTLVLVPTSAEGKLLWGGTDGKDGGGSTTWDSGKICPPVCPN